MQNEFNRQDLHRLKVLAPIGGVFYILWLFFDFIFIEPSMWNYCYAIRFGLPMFFIPLYVSRNIITSWIHVYIPFVFASGFAAILPLIFHTSYLEFYLVCCFLVPLISSSILIHSIKSYLFYPLFFAGFSMLYWSEISSLTDPQKYFILFYSSTILILMGFITHYNFLNRIHRYNLENKIKDSLEDKSSLVRILTHDISNVLMVLGGNFEAIKYYYSKKEKTAQIEKCFRIVGKSTKSLGEIIDKVKEMESIDGGKKELTLKKQNIFDIVKLTVEFIDDQYQEKNVELIINDNGLKWVDANIDATVFRYNVLNNLLTNALKFSNPHSKVEINLHRQDHYIIVEVRDYGIGIPKKMLTSIFDPSKKTTRSGTSGESGTGFGMPLAHSCTIKMNGILRLESKDQSDSPDDHGTSFFISFPISNDSNKIAA